ncbi:MAG TPA: fimbrial biogenesis outer membrane usher protein, partial [Arenibaculum sp.]|nr:fimbrial biogenesis outer membrane usher protein [Arenibaculum sp.]
VEPATAEGLRSAGGTSVPAASLERDGLSISVDAGELVLRVETAPHVRRTVLLDFATGGNTDVSAAALLRPATLSAYANLRATQVWSRPTQTGDGVESGREPLAAGVDGAVNLSGWVIEAEGFYGGGADRLWRRGNLRVVTDFVDSRLRFAAGDVAYPLAGFQGGQPLGGIAVARNFLLDPYETFTPSGQQRFVLEEPAVVEVEVNGRPTRLLRLAPGSYDLRNFPGTTGTNDVVIRITGQSGREQVIAFPFFFDNSLLAPGVHEFAYVAGLPSSVDDGRYSYDEDRAMVSGLHRFGLDDRLTLGANFQADRDRWLVGGEVLFASHLGTFGIEPAASGGDARGNGWAAAFRFRDFRTGEEIWRRRSLTGQAIWRSADFGSPGSGTGTNPVSWDIAARLGQPLGERTTLTLGTRYQVGRGGQRDAGSVETGLRMRFGRGIHLDIGAEHLRDADGGRETVGFASLRILFGDGRQSAAASYDTGTRERRVEWRYQDADPVDTLSASVEALSGRDGDGIGGDVAYTHRRFTASARHDLIDRAAIAGGLPEGTERRSSVTVATAVAFAGGHVGVSRPIADSFAIVAAHPHLQGRMVGVDPIGGLHGDLHGARSDLLGPAVVPSLSAYRLRPILIDVPESPPGYDLGDDRPVLLPGYRSGIVVPVGTDGVAGITGIVRTRDGAPVALQAGMLRPDDGTREDIPFFTNRSGRFRVDGLAPGRWSLVFTTIDVDPVAVEIAKDTAGTVDLGVVTP